MSFWRFQALKLIVGLGLLLLLILPTEFLIGYLVFIMPAWIAVGIGIIAWIGGTIFGTLLIARNLRKRWDR